MCPGTQKCGVMIVVTLVLAATGAPVSAGNIVLNFSDIGAENPEPTSVSSPYQSQGYTLTSTNGWAFNSPDRGNGTTQTPGSNLYYAGANALAAFAPATITLTQTNGNPFSLLSIDLARNFEFDAPPTVTFTGTLEGGGTVTDTFTVTTLPPPSPPAFQTFTFTGFDDVTSVSWDQPQFPEPLHQFTNITLATTPFIDPVPEPSSLILAGVGALGLAFLARQRRGARIT
jgi:hypothetical protein